MIIKALLILGFLATGTLIFRGSTTPSRLAMMRLGAAAALSLGIVAILVPEAVTALANAVGVTRGTDLVLYVLVVAFLLASVGVYRKVREIEDRYVELARRVAISDVSRQHEAGESSTLEQIA
jgi:hypothetical protein